MGNVTDKFSTAFRDYETDGVASSGPHEVDKAEVRALGPIIEAALANLGIAGLADVYKDTRANLNLDLAHAADTVALVHADSTNANNDFYIKVGASGSGSWTLTTILHDALEAAGKPWSDLAAAAAATIYDPGASSSDDLFAAATGDRSSVFYADVAGALHVSKLIEDRAPGSMYLETRQTDTNVGIATTTMQVNTHAGHAQNDKAVNVEFSYRDETGAASNRIQKVWTLNYVRERTRGDVGPFGPYTSVRNLIGDGVQDIIFGEAVTATGGTTSVDDGGTTSGGGFSGPGHGGVWEAEAARLFVDGVETSFTLPDRWTGKHIMLATTTNYYRNRSGNLLSSTGPDVFARSPFALVYREWRLLTGGTIECYYKINMLQKFTGSVFAPAVTVPDSVFTHLTRYADQVRRTALVDFVGRGGANSEQVTRAGCRRVIYHSASGGLELEVTSARRWSASNWPDPTAQSSFKKIEHTLKSSGEPKSYFTFYGDVDGANHSFANGDVLEFTCRFSPLFKRDF